MKKIIALLFAMALFVALSATSQIIRDKEKIESQKPKTEQTQKQNYAPSSEQTSSSKQSKSHNQKHQEGSKKRNQKTYEVNIACNVLTATLFIDESKYDNPNMTIYLKPGNHTVRIIAEGYEEVITNIRVEKNSKNFFIFKMVPLPAVVQKALDNMVYVEGGSFTMGATIEQGTDIDNDERPSHRVTISDYYISKFEVTQELWQAVMGDNPSRDKGDLNRPVTNVSWYDCKRFIRKLNSLTGKDFRLPTEAEWEYAARGGNQSHGYKYAGSNTLDSVAWCQKNNTGMSHPVGQKSPNELGLYDMSGNVNEWCEDWYESYSNTSQTNPKGPSTGSSGRVNRGGCWLSGSELCRISNRGYDDPSYAPDTIGLRLAI